MKLLFPAIPHPLARVIRVPDLLSGLVAGVHEFFVKPWRPRAAESEHLDAAGAASRAGFSNCAGCQSYDAARAIIRRNDAPARKALMRGRLRAVKLDLDL